VSDKTQDKAIQDRQENTEQDKKTQSKTTQHKARQSKTRLHLHKARQLTQSKTSDEGRGERDRDERREGSGYFFDFVFSSDVYFS
jgi:hypothetical protein